MRKKTLLFVIISLSSALSLSCENVLEKIAPEPKYVDDAEVKSNIYYQVAEYEFHKNWEEDLQNPMSAAIWGEYYASGWCQYKCNLSKEERASKVENVDWDISQNGGEHYHCFYIYYRVKCKKHTLYALVELTEFDSGEVEYDILAVESTLSAIKNLVM